ncbi:uncharacterized protein SPAPADRAFT_63063 [Spathaspora passalidarum NRRL Y-27907]|uniref:Succinate dehydrogenase [ubiquinone] cytochrome b small subunit n=1 Tax=Spathaspora passalidarum (strain NRRL Y-27907 / 11-Y1) TaxID=619300 RepID=G3AST8_SPAPN|nr:uncharacterized protein SPAPADRAFT_63063 [Spathaspora passalidarum NRRL Y-27907]EGW31152.1 hypothetical protein SPAPADRAFT_63063 [Spathaspora passalidarum NRRL Y-27907]
MLARQSIITTKPTHLILQRQFRLIPDFSKFKKIEQPPGYIVGTVNDAYIPPPTKHIDGSYHWTYDRVVTIGMIPLMMTPFIAGIEFPMVDSALSTLLLWHCHAGFKSCIIDYIPERVYGIWHKMATGLLTAGSCLGMYGIYVMETANNGLFELLSNIWHA